MAAVRSLRVSVKPDSGSDSDSESDKDAREAEPMEVEDGELEDEVSVSRSLKELLPVRGLCRPGTRVSCSPGERAGSRPLLTPPPRSLSGGWRLPVHRFEHKLV